MKGAFAVDKLKSVDRVTVVSSNGSVYFNRIGGMWINHIKGESLNDDDMGRLISAYEEFGWNTIYPESNAGFASDKQSPEQIDVGMDEEQAGELIVPYNARIVVIRTAGNFEHAYVYDQNESERRGWAVFRGPLGMGLSLDEIRSFIVVRLYKGHFLYAYSLDKDKNIIGESRPLA